MPDSSRAVRQGWRRRQASETIESRQIRRVLWSILAVLLLILFVWLLWPRPSMRLRLGEFVVPRCDVVEAPLLAYGKQAGDDFEASRKSLRHAEPFKYETFDAA